MSQLPSLELRHIKGLALNEDGLLDEQRLVMNTGSGHGI